jgi:hypothetical protein
MILRRVSKILRKATVTASSYPFVPSFSAGMEQLDSVWTGFPNSRCKIFCMKPACKLQECLKSDKNNTSYVKICLHPC